MSRQVIAECIKNNWVSFSWHVSERIRERKLNRLEVMNCLKYGLVRLEEDGKVVCSFQRLQCAIAKNSLGITICSAWRR
jgi:hypothetical protein